MIGADDARIDTERNLERYRAVAGQIAVAILLVHEDVGARLQLGKDAQVEVDMVRSRPRAADDFRREIRVGKRGEHGLQIVGALDDRGAALGIILDMLLRPAIILDAAPAQRRKRGDGARKVDRLFGRGDAGPRDAGIDVDQHVQRRALRRKRGDSGARRLMLKALNGLQFMHYYGLAKGGTKFEDFMPGWIDGRIGVLG